MKKPKHPNPPMTVSEIDALREFAMEQATLLDVMTRDNVELLALVQMLVSDEVISNRLIELKTMAIVQNLLARIAEDKGE